MDTLPIFEIPGDATTSRAVPTRCTLSGYVLLNGNSRCDIAGAKVSMGVGAVFP